MQTQVFISRPQTAQSPFRKKIESSGYAVIGESLIQFHPLPFEEEPNTEWVFFYSKKGVTYFLEQSKKSLSTNRKLACLGPGTAGLLKKHGYTPDFTGSGEPEPTAQAFVKQARGQSVLFVQALHSRQSIQKLLAGSITSFSLPVYTNELRTDFDIPACEVLTFTSPMNVEAYFAKYRLLSSQQCVAIGSVTARALDAAGVPKIHQAAQPNEAALARAVLQLLSGR
jgi:uroporphyrinogen-III synthase